jgi:hypothetical protein
MSEYVPAYLGGYVSVRLISYNVQPDTTPTREAPHITALRGAWIDL